MSEISNLISEYGVATVIAAALIVVFIVLGKRLSNAIGNLIELSGKSAMTIHTKEEEEMNRHKSFLIDLQLENLLIETKANRTSFFEYHNGGYGVTGRSFQKMSVMNEKVDPNTVPLMGSYQNLPRRIYPILIDELSQSGECYFNDIACLKEKDIVSYHWWSARNVKAVYIKAVIDNIKDIILGFITVEYVYNTCEETEKTELQISKASQRIGGLLQAEQA